MKPDDNKSLINKLAGSALFRDYARAYAEATGMPVALRPLESWQLPHRGSRNESPFCALMAGKSRACGACLGVQEKLARAAVEEPQTLRCPHGLVDSAVPVRLGDEVIGFLLTGQVFRRKPGKAQFERMERLIEEWEMSIPREELRKAWLATRVVPPAHYDACVRLLGIFAQHLSLLSNQIVVQRANEEPPMIARAKRFIEEHKTEDISLGQVAQAANASTYYFCRMFRKFTGVHFTEYLARVRLEKAKNLLLNPNLNVSEIAYEVGFQSLTHFNRVFRKIMGQSPTQFRGTLPAV